MSFFADDDSLPDLAALIGSGGARVVAFGVMVAGELLDEAVCKGGVEGSISGDGSSPRYMGRAPDRNVVVGRVLCGVDAPECDDTNVAGDESDALSTTVMSSRVAIIIAIEAFFALADMTRRDGVDPVPVASNPRVAEWECAAANALITSGSISRAENSARLTGLSCAGLLSWWPLST